MHVSLKTDCGPTGGTDCFTRGNPQEAHLGRQCDPNTGGMPEAQEQERQLKTSGQGKHGHQQHNYHQRSLGGTVQNPTQMPPEGESAIMHPSDGSSADYNCTIGIRLAQILTALSWRASEWESK